MNRKVIVGAAIASVFAAAALGRSDERTFDVKALKAAGQGRAVYLANCAGCHGADARGGLTTTSGTPAPDLTLIAVRDGRFDANHVTLHIDGRFMDRQGEMPRWGRVFSHSRPEGEGWATTRVHALTRYLDFVQAPPEQTLAQ